MRTTITLDEDVAALLRRVAQKKKLRFKELINEALRLGLDRMSSPEKRAGRYRTPSVELGRCYLNIDDVAEALAVAEDEAFR